MVRLGVFLFLHCCDLKRKKSEREKKKSKFSTYVRSGQQKQSIFSTYVLRGQENHNLIETHYQVMYPRSAILICNLITQFPVPQKRNKERDHSTRIFFITTNLLDLDIRKIALAQKIKNWQFKWVDTVCTLSDKYWFRNSQIQGTASGKLAKAAGAKLQKMHQQN